jgi:hypothetical protein
LPCKGFCGLELIEIRKARLAHREGMSMIRGSSAVTMSAKHRLLSCCRRTKVKEAWRSQ